MRSRGEGLGFYPLLRCWLINLLQCKCGNFSVYSSRNKLRTRFVVVVWLFFLLHVIGSNTIRTCCGILWLGFAGIVRVCVCVCMCASTLMVVAVDDGKHCVQQIRSCLGNMHPVTFERVCVYVVTFCV